MAINTPGEVTFEKVDLSLRGAARGRFAGLIQELETDASATIFVNKELAGQAKGSLVQAMRSRGKRLRSKSTSYNGAEGTVFWAEDKLSS